MNTSFNQFEVISYSWLGFSSPDSPAQAGIKESRICPCCGVHGGAVKAFCTRCGGMLKRMDGAERPSAEAVVIASAGPAPAAPDAIRVPETASRADKFLVTGAWLAILVSVAACGSYVSAMRAETRPVEHIAIEESGIIDSYDDQLPASITTVAGELVRSTNADGKRHVTLNGKVLSNGEESHWQFPMRVFDLPDNKQAILMASSGGYGFHCETRFFFLLASKQGVEPTPLFGTCAPRITFSTHGDAITFLLPRVGGLSTVQFKGGALTEDGVVLTLNEANNPFK